MRIEFTPKHIFFGFLFVLLVAYTLFQARFLILGPHLRVDTPIDGATTPTPVVRITGNAQNIAYISLNDRPIFIDAKGNFSEKLIAAPGLDIITLRARDRFGRSTEKEIRVVYTNQ
ncbi:MAG: seg [Parcubacteria group bacterium]|nr:seg [Parcubacteria group bacterium]